MFGVKCESRETSCGIESHPVRGQTLTSADLPTKEELYSSLRGNTELCAFGKQDFDMCTHKVWDITAENFMQE